MLLILYSVCGVLLGFIVGHMYGWEKRSLAEHGKTLSLQVFLRRIMFG